MSKTETKTDQIKPGRLRLDFSPDWPWSPTMAVIYTVFLYLSQYLVAFVLLLWPLVRHWDKAQSQAWLTNSIVAQFVFVLLAEGVTIWLLWLFIKKHKVSFKSLGWNRWPRWTDLGIAALAFVAYFVVLAIVMTIATDLIPALNTNQKQQLGFNSATAVWQLILAFISLVVLPPVVEETVFRGFLLGSLRKKLTLVQAAIGTSFLFAIAHLELGSGAPPLWAAAIDVFILSLALCFLRIKTGSLWAGVFLHSLKNAIAFLALFVFTFTI